MAIPKGTKANFKTLCKAMAANDVVVMEVLDRKTNEVVDALCMVNRVGDKFQMMPVAFMPRENPFERFAPPDVDKPDSFCVGVH